MKHKPDDVTFERTRHGHYSTRIRAGRHARTGKGQQLRVTIATTEERVFRGRLARLRELSAALITQGLTAEAAVAIKKAAAQPTDERFEVCCAAALELAPKVLAKPHQWNTFRELGEAWTRGDMHRRFPDHVKFKRTGGRDKGRLEFLYEVVVDAESKRKLGDMPLALITFEHANAAMVQLPDDCKRPAARRQYAQLIARVMKLAVFPAACIAASPLPVGFLPHVPEGDILFQHLYPDEDLRLMRCAAIDYGERALFGLSNREGGRLGEFLRKLKWVGIDVKRGTIMLPGGVHRKGGKPSKWQAEPGSIEALEPLRALGLEGPFYHLPDDGKWAERLIERMQTAGLDREALYYSNVDEGVRRMRGHDTRATYLTLGIASGLSETHLMARTGHTTSKMVHRYDHAAEALAASESGCRLMPLDYALGLYDSCGWLDDETLGAFGSRPPPGPRRAGWMTLDPRSIEAAALERLALPAGPELVEGAAPVLMLGPGGDDEGGPGGGVALLPSGTPANDGGAEAIEGELVEPAGGAGSGPRPLARIGRVSRAGAGGETLGETFSDVYGVCAAACGDETSMFSAVVAPAGLEPARLAARDFKCLESAHDGASDELSARNPVAGSDGKAHGDSPDDPRVRRSKAPPDDPVEASPEGPTATVDPVLAGLRAAAHAAVDRGDPATVAAIMAAIEAHRVALARAAEPAPAGGREGVG